MQKWGEHLMRCKNIHTFVICAYEESKYLEQCILSLKNQSVETNIILATSTPNEHIKRLCENYNIKMYVNEGRSGITGDWNFAYSRCVTPYVTIAHQDDLYEQDYVKNMLLYMRKADNPIIFFSDYYEIRNGKKIYNNNLLRIKRIMLIPLRNRYGWKSIFIRRRILSLGSPICCPSVTFVKDKCPDIVFENHFRAAEDWEAWEMLSKRNGSFVYCYKPLTGHRIHKDSETTRIIESNNRRKENYIMFRKFWPAPVARWLNSLYTKSEQSNNTIQ